MTLTNIRHHAGRHGPEVSADFTIADGRTGSVTVTLREFEAHGQRILEQEAAACARQARGHGYRAPGLDRYEELR